MERKTDHIVYTVPNLEAAIDEFEKLSGMRPVFGGYHTTKGTKNALINLGNDCYLEILAIDEVNTQVKPPRWMGVDLVKIPEITRWSLKSNQLHQDRKILQKYHPEMGVIQGGQRQTATGDTLTWEMILPLATPLVEVVPFMTDWQHSTIHPTHNLPQQCELIELLFTHPHPTTIQEIFSELNIDILIQKAEKATIRAKIKSPNGVFII